jgi:hypothetical protein
MTEIPLGLSFVEDDEGFTLQQKRADGAVAAIRMSLGEVTSLKATISLWIDRMMSRYQVGSGEVQPIVAHPIAQVRLLPDAVQENVLLTVAAPSGEQVTFSFPLTVADCIVAELPNLVAAMRAAKPMKQ